MDNLFEQAAQITKAYAYDIVSEQVKYLESENEVLKIELKAANAMLKAYESFVNDTKPLFTTNAILPNP